MTANGRRCLLFASLLVAGHSAAMAIDCARPGTICVPEEGTLENAFLTVPNDGTIDIAPGTYPAPASDAGFRLGTTAAARNRSFTVRARGVPGSVTLTGQGARRIVVLDSLAAGRWITFEGLRFVFGRSATANVAGGVTLKNARATFVDCEFVGNRGTSGSNGGAGLGLYGGAKAVVIGSLFEDNRTVSEGGALFAQRGFAPYDTASEAWVFRSVFRANCETGAALPDCSSGDGAGGAVLVRNSRLFVGDSRFESNTAGHVGGAIYSFGAFACSAPFCATPQADVLVVRSRFVANRANGSGAPAQTEAGAIHAEDCARVRVFQSVFEDNFADWGGAIESFRAALDIRDSVFRRNRAIGTGAIVAQGGTILAISGASPVSTYPAGNCPNANRDFPAPTLRLERSLVEGGSAAAQEAQTGGCVSAKGDAVTDSSTCQTTHTQRCAQVILSDSALFDCAVAKTATAAFVFGGGAVFERAHASLTDVLFARNRAIGNSGGVCARGGAGSVREGARLVMTDVLFSGNVADCLDQNLQVINAVPPAETNVRYYAADSANPADGKLLAMPTELAATFDLPGEGPVDGEAWLAHGWSGSGATLDGLTQPTNPRNSRQATGDGVHTLEVGGGAVVRTAAVALAAAPATTLGATELCPPGGTTTLSWTTPAGTFLAGIVDREVGGAPANGGAGVTAAGTVTWRRVVLTEEGSAWDEATVYVAECPLLVDGFESGDTSAWSSTQN